jgi:septal ring-binding cell division protein DamX
MIASEYDELDRELGGLDDARPRRGGDGGGLRLLPILVGVVSLLALGGIVWYAYSQGVREGSETAAPLLRPDGPAKEVPADPGGRQIVGTDLDVYDRVDGQSAPQGDIPEGAERLLPQPEEPIIPPAQPEAPAAPAETAAGESGRAPVPAPETPSLPDPELAAPEAPPPTVGEGTRATAEDVAAAEGASAEPAAPAAPEPAAEPESAAQPAPETASAAPAQPEQTAAAPATASAAGDGWRIQIAALTSESAARDAWNRHQQAHQALLGPLALQIQQANVNGTTYYRVRGGPLQSRDAARDLCTKLKAAGAACIPVAPGN